MGKNTICLFIKFSDSSEEKCLKKMCKMKNTPRLYVSEGKIAYCLIEARRGVDHNTTRARTGLCPVQTNVLLRHYILQVLCEPSLS